MKEKNLIHKEQQPGLQVYSRTRDRGEVDEINKTPGKLWEGRRKSGD